MTPIASAGTFTSSDQIAVAFVRSGDKGTDGTNGANAGFLFTLDRSTTSMADPTTGKIRFNNASFNSTTALAISDLSSDAGNPDVSAAILAWAASTNGTKGQISIRKVGSAQNFVVFDLTALTDNSGWTRFALTFKAAGGTLATNDICVVTFAQAGNKGIDGTDGADGTILNPLGDYSAGTTYALNDVVLDQGSSWVALQATTGNAPPTLPTTSNTYWQLIAQKGADGTGTGTVTSVNGLLPSAGNVVVGAADIEDGDTPTNYTPASSDIAGHLQGIDDAIAVAGTPSAPQGRLTLTTAVSITTTDVAGSTNIFYTPVIGLRVPLYDGTLTKMVSIGAELTLALDSSSGHTGYHQSGKIFDLFIINDSGTIRLATGPAWSSDSSRGTGAGTTELELKNGFLTNKQTLLARFGASSGNTVSVAANQALYVGSFRATADGQASDTQAQRFLFNAYNQAKRFMYREEATATWTYSTAAFHQANGSAANQLAFLAGLPGQWVDACLQSVLTNSTSTVRQCYLGIGINSTTVDSSTSGIRNMPGQNQYGASGVRNFNNYVPLGYSYLAWLEQGAGADTQTWYGGAGSKFAGSIWA